MALRPHPGQATSASHLRAFLADSPILASHRIGDGVVQDAYSRRGPPRGNRETREVPRFVRGVREGGGLP